MNNKYDIIVIGGGHNGLTTASILAKKGMKVLLLEQRNILGGLAAGEEFYPGYRTNGFLHDTSQVRTELLKDLNLPKYGLKTTGMRGNVALLSKRGPGILLYSDRDKAANEISGHSRKDANAYLKYRIFIDEISGFLWKILNEIPPDLVNFQTGQVWTLIRKGFALRRLGKNTMLELMKVTPMSVSDFLNEKFETEFLKAGLAGPALFGSFTAPRSSFTTLNLLLWDSCARVSVIGGPQALASALELSAKDARVEIITGAKVSQIMLDSSGRVIGVQLQNKEKYSSKAVAASCSPKHTFLDLISPSQIAYPLERVFINYRSRGTTAKLNLALNRPIEFSINSEDPVEFARTGNSLDEMEKAFDPVKYRKFSDEPILDIHVPTVANPQLAPDGHSVASILIHYAPHHFEAGWTEIEKEKLKDNVLRSLEKYSPGISQNIVGYELISPKDIGELYSLPGGHIYHGEHAVDQMITRPVPSCARYGTPIPGLYLCGSGSHPGGGITCGPGALAAKVIQKHF